MQDDLQTGAVSPEEERDGKPVSLPEKYETKQDVDRGLAALKQRYPAVTSAYQPSGKSTPAARIAMIVALPVVFAFTAGLCFLLLYGAAWITSGVAGMDTTFEFQRWWNYSRLGLVLFLVDTLIVLTLMVVPPWLYTRIGRLFKNRSGSLPTLLSALTSVPLAILLFWPIWSGFSLAPTELTFLSISIKWVIIIGSILLSVFSVFLSFYMVSLQKFCEETGVFLKPLRRYYFDFRVLESALKSLSNKAYQQINDLNPLSKKERKKKTHSELVLWGHDAAQTAYLEVLLVFNEVPVKNATDRKKESWLVFSEKLYKSEMEDVCREMSEK